MTNQTICVASSFLQRVGEFRLCGYDVDPFLDYAMTGERLAKYKLLGKQTAQTLFAVRWNGIVQPRRFLAKSCYLLLNPMINTATTKTARPADMTLKAF